MVFRVVLRILSLVNTTTPTARLTFALLFHALEIANVLNGDHFVHGIVADVILRQRLNYLAGLFSLFLLLLRVLSAPSKRASHLKLLGLVALVFILVLASHFECGQYNCDFVKKIQRPDNCFQKHQGR